MGKGSYGSVFRAKNKKTGKEVAIKIIDTTEQEGGLKEVVKEINFLVDCDNENVVRYFDSFLKDKELWIIMEYCGAGSIADVCDIVQQGLKEEQIKYVIRETLKGVLYLHEHKKLHRDIKGGNILLTEDGRVKLVDFGVSVQLSATLQKRDTLTGTPYWMAPEVILQNAYDGKADIWSIGITAIELAEMVPPLSNIHPMRALFMIPTNAPPTFKEPNSWSKDMKDFVAKCLVKTPDERPTAKQLLEHPFIKSAKDAKVIKPLIDLASAIVRERGYRYQDESDGSSSEVGSDIEQAFEEVSFEKKEDTDSSDEESNTLMIQKTPNRSQRKAVTIKFDDIVVDTDSEDEGTVYYKNTDTFKMTPNLPSSDLKAAQDSLKRIAAANQTDSLKQALNGAGLNQSGDHTIGTHRKKSGTVKSGYSTVKRRSRQWVPPALDKAVLRFVVKCPTQFGQHVILIGSSEELGSWQVGRRMTFSHVEDDVPCWAVEVPMPFKTQFEYKYIVSQGLTQMTWETGTNRKLLLDQMIPGTIEIRDIWETTNLMRNPLQVTLKDMQISMQEGMYVMLYVQYTSLITDTTRVKVVGAIEQFGEWQATRAFTLTRTSVPGWYRALVMVNESRVPFEYKYVLYDEADGTTLWESGSNRVLENSASNQMIALIVKCDYFHDK
jgi:serine/threonine protein kinase